MISTDPLLPPLQRTSTLTPLKVNAVGSLIVYELFIVQPLASLTTTSKVPAVKPVKSSVASPLDHA